MSEVVIWQFERLFVDIRDRMDRYEALQKGVPNARRQSRQEPRVEVRDQYGDDSDTDGDALVEAEMERMRNRGIRLQRRGKNLEGDEVNESMSNIKMSIPPFK